MRSIHILLSILVPAALTFGLRALPFLLLNKRELPKRMEYLGKVFLWQLWLLLWYTA